MGNGPGRIKGYTRAPRARRAGWASVLVGLLGLSTGGALTVIGSAQAQTDGLAVAASAEACSPVVAYKITPPADLAADPSFAPHYALWFRTDGTAEWTPAADEAPLEVTALAGDVDTGLSADADVTVRVQALDATSAPTGDAVYASASVACDTWPTDETTTTTKAAAESFAALDVAVTQGVRVHKGGDRDGTSDTITGLEGATMGAYTGTDANPLQTLVGTCVTDGTGTCEIQLANGSYFVSEVTAPAGYQRIDNIGLGSATSDLDPGRPYARGYSNSVPTYASPIAVTTNTIVDIPSATTSFANRRVNPGFPDRCGIKLGLVFDLSSSIDSGELSAMKSAAQGFVTSLANTPSQVALYTFATTAPALPGQNKALRPVSDPAINTDIQALTQPSGGNTNYDGALRQIGSGLDAVAFLTDGNPNRYGAQGAGGSTTTTYQSIEQATASANTLKSFGTKIIAVGIGSAASEVNLKPISGPTPNDDYFLAASFGQLEQTLKDLATKLCGGSLSVVKKVKAGDTYVPASGWQFAASSAPTASAVATPANGVTGADGVVNYKYSSGQTLAVTATETLQPGFTLAKQGAGANARNATCTKNNVAVAPADITDTTNGVTVAVGPTDIVSCEFHNDPNAGSITIKKVTTDGDAVTSFPFSSTLTTDPPGGAFALTGGGSKVFSTAPGTYTVTEADPGPSGWRLDQLSCTGNGQGGSTNLAQRSATIVLAPGGDVVCTYTNAPRVATVKVRKLVDGEQTAEWTVNGTVPAGQSVRFGPAGTSESVQTTANGAAAFTGLTRVSTAGSTLDLAETQQPGYLAGGVQCTADGESKDGTAGSIALVVTPGDDWTCTFNNFVNTAKVTVLKSVDGSEPVEGWTFDGTLGSGPAIFRGGGTTDSKTTAGDPVPSATFTIDRIPTGGTTDVTIAEQLQAGFGFDALECVNADEQVVASVLAPAPPTAAFAVHPDDDIVCAYDNHTAPGSITIVKDAQPDSSQEFSYTTTGGLTPSEFTLADDGTGTGDTIEFTGLMPKRYTIDETDPGSLGWKFDTISCEGDAPYTIDGPRVTIDLGPEQSVLCTYTNTRNAASVKVIKELDGTAVAGWDFDGTLGAGPAVFAGGGTEASVTTAGTPPAADLDLVTVPSDGAALTLAEQGQPGYSFDEATCRNERDEVVATAKAPADPSVDLSVLPGDEIVCTFENLTNTASVQVIKNVDGAAVADWTFDGTLGAGPAVFQGDGKEQSVTTAGDADPSATFAIDTVAADGSSLTVAEQLKAGFAFDEAECVVTNDDDRVIASASAPDSPSLDMTVSPGDEIRCTFENHDAPGTITIAKATKPAGSETEFSFAADSPLAPTSFSLADGGSQQFTELLPGTYVVREDDAGSLGYRLTAIDCDVEGDATVDKDLATGTVTIELGLDDSVLCTYTNTQNTADITVIKRVGDEAVAGWTFDASLADGPAVFAGVPAPGTSTTLTTAGDPAKADATVDGVPTDGVELTLSEQAQVGYTFDQAVCAVNGVDGTPVTSPADPSIAVTVKPGDDVVCTFTNAEVPGTITIVKDTGDATPRPFDFTATGGLTPSTFTLFSAPEDGTRTFTDVPSGTYTVTEDDPGPLGWDLTSLTCTTGGSGDVASRTATIELAPAASVTCTFTDAPTTASVSVRKLVDGAQTAAWTIDGTVPDGQTARFGDDATAASESTPATGYEAFPELTRVSSGGSTVHLAEQEQAGFTTGAVSCVSGDVTVDGTTPGEIDLSVRPGDTWECTFANSLNTATVEVVKQVSGNAVSGWTFDGALGSGPATFAGGSKVASATTAGSPALATFALVRVPEGGASLDLAEQLQTGYSFAGVTCAVVPDQGVAEPIDTGDSTDPEASVTVLPGDLVRCTFTNNFLPASILLTKSGAASVNAGSDTSFSVVVTNNGEVPLTNAVVTDPVPSGVTFVSATVIAGNPGLCTQAAGVITCTLDGTLEVDETATISIVVNVPATTTLLSFTNVADVTADPPACPPVETGAQTAEVGALASACPVTSTDDHTVPVITVGGETVVDVPVVLSGTLPFTGPAGLALLKTAGWLLAFGGFLSVTHRRRRTA